MTGAKSPVTVYHDSRYELYDQLTGTKTPSGKDSRPASNGDLAIISRIIDQFWESAAFDRPASLCIDSSPFYPAMGGQGSLPQTIFVSEASATAQQSNERKLFEVYFSNALQTIRTGVLLFFHPVLTGHRREGTLIPGHKSKVVSNPLRRPAAPITRLYADAYEWIMQGYNNRAIEDGMAETQDLVTTRHSPGSNSIITYRGTVKGLRLPDVGDYPTFVRKYFSNDGIARPALDSGDAFQAMNSAYHIRLSDRLRRLLPDVADDTSFLSMFPVNLVAPDKSGDTLDTSVPTEYRGACWIYLTVSGPVDRRTESRLRRALNQMERELWFILSSEYNRRAANAIASLERSSARGSVLHQLTTDFASMGQTIADMKELVSGLDERDRERLLEKVQRLDVFLVQGMFLGAMTRRRRLQELPADLAEALHIAVTGATVQPIFDRLVRTVAIERVAGDRRWAERGWRESKRPSQKQLEEAGSRVDLLFPSQPTFAPGLGLYPLLLSMLRNAYQHALVWAVLNPGERAVLEVKAGTESQRYVVTILNTGLQTPLDSNSMQMGTMEDVQVFHGLTEDWAVVETETGRFSTYSPQLSRWITSIARDVDRQQTSPMPGPSMRGMS